MAYSQKYSFTISFTLGSSSVPLGLFLASPLYLFALLSETFLLLFALLLKPLSRLPLVYSWRHLLVCPWTYSFTYFFFANVSLSFTFRSVSLLSPEYFRAKVMKTLPFLVSFFFLSLFSSSFAFHSVSPFSWIFPSWGDEYISLPGLLFLFFWVDCHFPGLGGMSVLTFGLPCEVPVIFCQRAKCSMIYVPV